MLEIQKYLKKSIIIYYRKCKQPFCERFYTFNHIREYYLVNGDEIEKQSAKKFTIKHTAAVANHTEQMTSRLKGLKREQLREVLKTNYVSNVRNESMLNTDLNLKQQGNLNNYRGTVVLDQVRKEALADQDDAVDDIEDLKQKMDKENETDAEITLHNLVIKRPFTIYSFSQTQLSVLKKLKKREKVLTGHVDSTGNIVRTPVGDYNKVLYTVAAVNIKNIDGKSALNFPFLELLSTLNTAFTIKMWLQYFKNEYEKYSMCEWPLFDHMISDFSRPILYAISEGWNNIKLIDYVNLIYDCYVSKNFNPLKSLTKIHLCYSHLLKNFSRTIKKHYCLKTDTEFVFIKIFNILRFILNESDLSKVKKAYFLLHQLCNETSAEYAENFIIDLSIETEMHSDNSSKIDSEYFEDPNRTEIESIYDLTGDKRSIYKESKFFKDFSLFEHVQRDTANITNTFYRPKFVEEILKVFIPYLPLFIELIPQDLDIVSAQPLHRTNAVIESLFGEIKMECERNSFQLGKTPLKAG